MARSGKAPDRHQGHVPGCPAPPGAGRHPAWISPRRSRHAGAAIANRRRPGRCPGNDCLRPWSALLSRRRVDLGVDGGGGHDVLPVVSPSTPGWAARLAARHVADSPRDQGAAVVKAGPGDVRRYRERGAGMRPAGAPARRLSHRQQPRTRLAGWLPVSAHRGANHTPGRPAQAGGDMRVTRRPLRAWARAPPLPGAAPACPAGRIQAASSRSRSASPVIAAGAAAVETALRERRGASRCMDHLPISTAPPARFELPESG